MAIHHTQQKKAKEMGVILSEDNTKQDGIKLYKAHWPKLNWAIYATDAKSALQQMHWLQEFHKQEQTAFIAVHETTKVLMGIQTEEGLVGTFGTIAQEPVAQYNQWVDWSDGNGELVPFSKPTPLDMAEQLTPEEQDQYMKEVNGDAPVEEDGEDNQEEEGEEEEGEEDAGGGRSVVKSRYRQRYAELGHPKHCGDWLAVTLNEICGGKHTNIAEFEAICDLNGVDLSKYNRTNQGWQGRLRMTGRNRLAKAVWFNDGILKVPPHVNSDGYLRAPSDWLAAQRFAQ